MLANSLVFAVHRATLVRTQVAERHHITLLANAAARFCSIHLDDEALGVLAIIRIVEIQWLVLFQLTQLGYKHAWIGHHTRLGISLARQQTD